MKGKKDFGPSSTINLILSVPQISCLKRFALPKLRLKSPSALSRKRGSACHQLREARAATRTKGRLHCRRGKPAEGACNPGKGKPPDQRAIYRSAQRLASLCDSLGQSEEAINFYQKAIAAGTQIDDVPYSDIGTMLNNIALILRKSGRQKAAEPCYVRALEIYEKQLGPDHPDVASVLNNLAVFYTNERRYTEAEKIHLRALGIREKLNPPPLADIAQSKCNLAVVYHSRGDYAKAAELYQSSLKTWEAGTREALEGLRYCCFELRRPFAFHWPGPQSAPAGGARPEEALGLIQPNAPRFHPMLARCILPCRSPGDRTLYSYCLCSRGGIGRRVRLRTVWGNPWRFESSREH